MAEKASDLDVTRWLAELETQRGHAKAEASVLVMKRKGISGDNADRWWAVMQMPVRTIEGRPTGHWVPCRMTLEQACVVLRLWGYGSAPDEEGAA